MAEPEDLILDGAQIASRLARQIWDRHAARSDPKVLRLADVRVRLELVLSALFEAPLAVTAAEPPAPASWLARFAGRAVNPAADLSAGTDGIRIYLPPIFDATRGVAAAFEGCLLLAVQQAARLARGSLTALSQVENEDRREHFLLADAIGVDGWIVRETPGLVPALRAARRESLARRARFSRPPGGPPANEARLRNFLAHDPLVPFPGVPVTRNASEALACMDASALGDPVAASHQRILPAWYWGRPYSAPPAMRAGDGGRPDEPRRPVLTARVSEMRRRPRVREASEDEDDKGSGWSIVRADEPQESVEDPFGLERPADRSDDADPEALGDSLADLPEARVVRTPGQAREILRAGDEQPRVGGDTVPFVLGNGAAYPEWDFRSGTYRRPGAIVRGTSPPGSDLAWATSALARHHTLVRRVRTRFERLRPRPSRVGRQRDGAELDIAEYVSSAADSRAGVVAEDRLYVDVRPRRRELTVCLLVDVSASTDAWVSGQQRIVDVQKDAVLVVCEALAALGDPHAVLAFSGESAEHVSIQSIKAFTEHSGEVVRRRIGGLEPDGYTRMGAAVRHATAGLCRHPTERRLLLILSDGKPNDVDAYDGRYGIEDTRQAVAEARAQNVDVFCVTVDREAPGYAPRIFGRAGFTLLRRPDQLPEVLISVVRRLVRS